MERRRVLAQGRDRRKRRRSKLATVGDWVDCFAPTVDAGMEEVWRARSKLLSKPWTPVVGMSSRASMVDRIDGLSVCDASAMLG